MRASRTAFSTGFAHADFSRVIFRLHLAGPGGAPRNPAPGSGNARSNWPGGGLNTPGS
jgi:hypothetical protein